jgi:hypothetical protein
VWIHLICPACGYKTKECDYGRLLILSQSHAHHGCRRKDDLLLDFENSKKLKFNEYPYWGLWAEGEVLVYIFLNPSSKYAVVAMPVMDDDKRVIDNPTKADAYNALRRYIVAAEEMRTRHTRVAAGECDTNGRVLILGQEHIKKAQPAQEPEGDGLLALLDEI